MVGCSETPRTCIEPRHSRPMLTEQLGNRLKSQLGYTVRYIIHDCLAFRSSRSRPIQVRILVIRCSAASPVTYSRTCSNRKLRREFSRMHD